MLRGREGALIMAGSIKVLVTGATGKQGGAVARRLLAKGHRVRAFTRHLDSEAARALAASGAEVVAGGFDDRGSIDRALDGVDALFLMTMTADGDNDLETRQGIIAADAARAKDIYVVFSSVGSANRRTGIPHFETKYAVEEHLRKIGARAAILAPVFFMENATTMMREQLKQGVYAVPVPPDRKLAQIAVEDIAAAAVTALEQPERFADTRYDLAGDELTGTEAAAILSRVTGRPFSFFQVPLDVIRQSGREDYATMFEWFDRVGYSFDAQRLRRDFPEVRWHSFEAWAREQDWTALFGS
jgi:uncharacterized protein YbjT (DUF2867 family)